MAQSALSSPWLLKGRKKHMRRNTKGLKGFLRNHSLAIAAVATLTACGPEPETPPEEGAETVIVTQQELILGNNYKIAVHMTPWRCLYASNIWSNTSTYLAQCNSANPYARWNMYGSPNPSAAHICNVGRGQCLVGNVAIGQRPYVAKYASGNGYQWWHIKGQGPGLGAQIQNAANKACLDVFGKMATATCTTLQTWGFFK